MLLDIFATGAIGANCILLADSTGGPLAVIDPGDEDERILARVEATGRTPGLILHTHAHFDHAGATAAVARALGPHVPIGLHPGDFPIYQALDQQARLYGHEVDPPPAPTLWLEDGQRLALGALTIEVRHTPGHSPGGVSFVVAGEAQHVAIVGDVLFRSAVGRTDLWGGSFEVLEQSIRTKLYSLPDHTTIVPGHGPTTTIGRERASNPFVRDE